MKKQMNAAVQAYNYECLDCGEPIQNLLCPNCISKHFEQWISQHPGLKKKTIPKLKKYLKFHNKYNDYPKCSACGKPICYSCPYCFTEYLFDLLKENNANQKILADFFELFNYDFEHWGYSQEIDKLGIY